MTAPLAIQLDVADLAKGAGEGGHFRRVVALSEDGTSLIVATMTAGEGVATTELTFRLDEARALAERVLSGDRRAMTRPGLARILSATAALLFRVSLAAGAIQETPEPAGGGERDGHLRDQPAAGGDEDPDQ